MTLNYPSALWLAFFVPTLVACDAPPATSVDASAPPRDAATDLDTGPPRDSGPTVDSSARGDAGSPVLDAGAVTDPFSTDRDLFFGDSRCGDGFLLCEDFESGAIDGARWSERPYMGTGEVASGMAARGSRALHVVLSTTPGSSFYLQAAAPLLPIAGNRHFGRAFFFIDDQPTARSDGAVTIHWNLVEASGPASIGGTTYRPQVRWGGILRNHPDLNDQWFLFNYEMPGGMRPPGFAERAVGADHSPREDWLDHWICAEWELAGDDSEGRFWSDGTELDALHVRDDVGGDYITMPTPFETIRIGWQHYQPVASAYDVWIDEIVIDDERIGCVR